MHTAPFRLMPTRLLSTMDVNQSTPAEIPPHRQERRYECLICEHMFTIVGGFDKEICPGCDEDCRALP